MYLNTRFCNIKRFGLLLVKFVKLIKLSYDFINFVYQMRHFAAGFILSSRLHLKASLNSIELVKAPFIRILPGQWESSSAHLMDVSVCVSHHILKMLYICNSW